MVSVFSSQQVFSQTTICVHLCLFSNIISDYSGGGIFINNTVSSVFFNLLSFISCSSMNNLTIGQRVVGGGAYAVDSMNFMSKCLLIDNCFCIGDGSGFYSRSNLSCSHHYNQSTFSNIPNYGRCVGHIDRGDIVSSSVNSSKSGPKDFSGIVFGNRYQNTVHCTFCYSTNNYNNCPFYAHSTLNTGYISHINIINNTVNGTSLHSFYLDLPFEVHYGAFFGNGYCGYCKSSLTMYHCQTDNSSFISTNVTLVSCSVSVLTESTFAMQSLECIPYAECLYTSKPRLLFNSPIVFLTNILFKL